MMTFKRKREPAHYMLKIESFSLLSEAKASIIQSDVFEASGHKWRLDLYPNGNKEVEKAGDHISLYLVLCDTESLAKGWEVCVDVNISVYDHKNDNYATFQGVGGNRIRFHELKIKWGFDKLISVESFKESKNGYLCNDSCVFGAEIFNILAYTQKDRCLSLIKPPAAMNTCTWRIGKFSALTDKELHSEVFKVGKVKWKLLLFPKGDKQGKGTCLSIYLRVYDADSFPDGWRVYAMFKLRVRNKFSSLHREKETEIWLHDEIVDWGYPQFMLLSELRHHSNGFLMNDTLIIEAEILLVGIFKNFI